MSDPETPSQPLIRAPSQQTSVDMPAQRSSRAYKVAGLTLLACVLIVGQATIAYFLFTQRSDIQSLQEQNNQLMMDLTKPRFVSVPGRMHAPMNSLGEFRKDFVLEATTSFPEKSGDMEDVGDIIFD